MSLSPSSSLVRRTIDLKYANRQRSASIKWICVNGALFLLFTLDLWYKCPGHTSALHYVEACLAAGACASAARHALRLAAHRVRPAPGAPALSRAQCRLLGLTGEPLDSSFSCGAEEGGARGPPEPGAAAEEPGSLSPARSWRARGSGSPGSGSSSPGSGSPALEPGRALRDEFIADAGQLARYLSSASDEAGASSWAEAVPPPPPPAYQVSPLRPEAREAAAGAGAGAAGAGGGAAGPAPAPWRRLQLDPSRLAHFNLNLRRWLHVTVLERLVREMEGVDAALAGAGHEARVGAASAARLAALAQGAAAPPALARRLRALLPFLRPFADQAYAARRVRELARGGCLAAYRWDGGGAGWDAARPPDAELVLQLFAAYLDGVVPGGGGGGGGAFSAAHLSAAPAPPPLGAGALALHRAQRTPPHYVVVVGRAVLDAGGGRDNLLHSLLVFVGAAARRDPPALLRLHLGPAGLNMLWILDR